jgi:hypothetical protein
VKTFSHAQRNPNFLIAYTLKSRTHLIFTKISKQLRRDIKKLVKQLSLTVEVANDMPRPLMEKDKKSSG